MLFVNILQLYFWSVGVYVPKKIKKTDKPCATKALKTKKVEYHTKNYQYRYQFLKELHEWLIECRIENDFE